MTKRHDTASTPIDRLLARHPNLVDPHDLDRLQALRRDTDLIGLNHHITDIQANLLKLARRRGPISRRAKTNHVYLNGRKIGPTKRAKPHESTTPNTRAS